MATVPNPKTYAVGETLTATTMNQEVRDAMNFLLNPPRANVYHSTTQSHATSGQYQIVQFDSEFYDSDTMHDPVTNNSRITIKTAGLYLVMGQIYWAGNTTGMRGVSIRGNGANALAYDFRASTNTLIQQVSLERYFDVNDYIELNAYQSSGAALIINGGANGSFMSARWVSK